MLFLVKVWVAAENEMQGQIHTRGSVFLSRGGFKWEPMRLCGGGGFSERKIDRLRRIENRSCVRSVMLKCRRDSVFLWCAIYVRLCVFISCYRSWWTDSSHSVHSDGVMNEQKDGKTRKLLPKLNYLAAHATCIQTFIRIQICFDRMAGSRPKPDQLVTSGHQMFLMIYKDRIYLGLTNIYWCIIGSVISQRLLGRQGWCS